MEGPTWQKWALGILTAALISVVSAGLGSAWQAGKTEEVLEIARSAQRAANENSIRLEGVQSNYRTIQGQLRDLDAKLDRLIESQIQ